MTSDAKEMDGNPSYGLTRTGDLSLQQKKIYRTVRPARKEGTGGGFSRRIQYLYWYSFGPSGETVTVAFELQ